MPLFSSLEKKAAGSRLWIGNQSISATSGINMTGEVSAKLVKSLGSDLVMIGHAERRAHFDNDEDITSQLNQACQSRLRILYCIGESRAFKDSRRLREFLRQQLRPLSRINNPLILAYEPVFAIGTKGRPASTEYVANSLAVIAEEMTSIGKSNVPLLYGGSVNAQNAESYATLQHCDGLFVGRSAWSERGFESVFLAGYRGFMRK